MSGSIQEAIYQGYGFAAEVLGSPCSRFRAVGDTNPLSHQISTVQAAFDVDPQFSFKRSTEYGNAIWYGLFDATDCAVGDYIVSPTSGMFFIAALDSLHPPMCVQCNQTVSILRPHSADGVGEVGYGGDEASEADAVMSAWPASVISGAKGTQSDADLPGDTSMPAFTILIPALPGIDIKTADVMTDNLGRRYKIWAAEITNLGWRLKAGLTQT